LHLQLLLQLLLQLQLQLQLQSLFVLAVILSAAKDPETFHPSKPIGPFNHILLTAVHLRTPITNSGQSPKQITPQTPANQPSQWPQKC
jgi:hypothetical protein